MSLEIERKFLLDRLPQDLHQAESVSIRQGYLFSGKDREIRIRQIGNTYLQTVKTGEGLIRQEIEVPLKKYQFDTLWEGTEGVRLEKIRYTYFWDGCSLFLDEYRGKLDGLIVGEVEFPSIEEARGFQSPGFFLEEITYDPRYRNRKLAKVRKRDLKTLLISGTSHSVIGTIPFFDHEGERKVVLVTRRKENQWIFPKGQQEKKLSHHKVALIEAIEEAGIEGEVAGIPIRIPYRKGDDHMNMLAFPLKVTKVLKHWDEEKERKRKIVSIKDAYRLSDQPAVHCGLRFLEQMF